MKYFKDWRKILLDTTVLCSLFRSEKSNSNVGHDKFVRKLIDYLTSNKTSDGEDRIFLISAITLAELLTKEEDLYKIKRIMRVLQSNNIEFVDFDFEVGMAFNLNLKDKLEKKQLHLRAKEIGFKSQDFAMAREWITKDYMIAMCGIVNNSDVILTADKNTFFPILKDIPNSYCVLTYEELFNCSEKFILGYNEKDVEAFLNKSKLNSASIIEKKLDKSDAVIIEKYISDEKTDSKPVLVISNNSRGKSTKATIG